MISILLYPPKVLLALSPWVYSGKTRHANYFKTLLLRLQPTLREQNIKRNAKDGAVVLKDVTKAIVT